MVLTPDSCVVWTAESIKALNIEKGKPYSKNVYELALAVKALIEQRVELHCLFDGCGETTVKIPDGLQALINYVCQLNTDDVVSRSNLYCLGVDSISPTALKLTNKKLKVNTNATSAGGNITYNLSDIVEALPQDYNVSKVEVVGYGKPKNGSSIVFSSQSTTGTLPVPNDRYPLNLDVELTLNGPEGVVKMRQNVSVPSSSTQLNTGVGMDVKDYGGFATEGISLTNFLDVLASQVCENKNAITTLKVFEVGGTPEVQFQSNDRNVVIGTIVANLSEAISRLNKIGSEKLDSVDCSDDCGERVNERPLQDILNMYGSTLCNLLERTGQLEQEVAILNQKIRVCCGENTAGGSGNIGVNDVPNYINSGCAGGNCPGGNLLFGSPGGQSTGGSTSSFGGGTTSGGTTSGGTTGGGTTGGGTTPPPPSSGTSGSGTGGSGAPTCTIAGLDFGFNYTVTAGLTVNTALVAQHPSISSITGYKINDPSVTFILYYAPTGYSTVIGLDPGSYNVFVNSAACANGPTTFTVGLPPTIG